MRSLRPSHCSPCDPCRATLTGPSECLNGRDRSGHYGSSAASCVSSSALTDLSPRPRLDQNSAVARKIVDFAKRFGVDERDIQTIRQLAHLQDRARGELYSRGRSPTNIAATIMVRRQRRRRALLQGRHADFRLLRYSTSLRHAIRHAEATKNRQLPEARNEFIVPKMQLVQAARQNRGQSRQAKLVARIASRDRTAWLTNRLRSESREKRSGGSAPHAPSR